MLEENPRYAYLVGMLDVQSDDEDSSSAGEQEIDADMAYEDGEDFTAGEEDDNEPCLLYTSAKQSYGSSNGGRPAQLLV